MQSQKGFTFLEAFGIIFIIALIVVAGIFVYKHDTGQLGPKVDTSHKQVESYIDGPNSDSKTTIDHLRTIVGEDFKHQDSFMCSVNLDASKNPCGQVSPNTISLSDFGYIPSRRVQNYKFFVDPTIEGTDVPFSLLIDTLNKPMTKVVLDVLSDQFAKSNFMTDSAFKSDPEPDNSRMGNDNGSSTFYSKDTLCEIEHYQANDEAGRTIIVGCAPFSIYKRASTEAAPLFDAYVAARPQFAHPEKTGDWLRFLTNTGQTYTTNSNKPGYKVGTVTLEDLSPGDKDGEKSGDAFFYAKNNQWHLVADKLNSYALPCSYKFNDAEAHAAYVGMECMTEASGRSILQ